MGFFSADCNGCGHPLLSVYATNETNGWMNNGVTVFPDGSIAKGSYDGYGRYEPTFDPAAPLSGEPVEGVLEGTVWHQPCWKVAGSPTDFRGVSKDSEDQGYFFDEGEHDMPEPQAPASTPPPAAAEAVTVDPEEFLTLIDNRLAALPEKRTDAAHGAARALADLRAHVVERYGPPNDESDLPASMQPGWDPLTPGREAEARFLDACIAEGVDPREADPDRHWS